MSTDPEQPPIFDGHAVVEHLPGEPRREPPGAPRLVLLIVARTLTLVVLAVLTSWLWPLHLVARLRWGRPPNVPRLRQVRRYLRLIWIVRPPSPGLLLGTRVWLTLSVIRKVVLTPVWGLAWNLDWLLYGERLRSTAVVAPLLEISAARSGSTQLARYIEDDPRLAAPTVLQAIFPYLWLWRLVPRTLGRFITIEQARQRIESRFPPEFRERHEGDPFRTDTFEGALYISHLNHLSPFLGPDVMTEDFGFAGTAEHNRTLWEVDFVEYLDGVARKILLHAGPGPDGRAPRFFAKGHFLAAAEALARRYPDARFLTMIRDPGPRLRSAVNFLRVNPADPVLPNVPWVWVGEALVRTEVAYCELEQRWYGREDGVRRCVLRFSEYVRDLEGTMETIYRECLDCPTLPEHVPREHEPRRRSDYMVDRTLAQVGIDEDGLDRRLRAYREWCRGG
ncbi:sulfotransferase [Paraliomyxa miuraensis]|uniref:sulfotransferase n=1 Tax=Paraliomyxa miuraensis TaxID=376150 RepID=UPI002252FCF0|nr:sulfotransferase [Paraliomyxa miuraensis]MCX4240455.1 sulfotransferase [Paraliomyxa miuraensis]